MASSGSLGDHLANERTYLAWIRTSIGIMAFGFVVEKFALFMRRLSSILGARAPSTPGYSEGFGIAIVALGALLGLLAYVRFKKVQRQIAQGAYEPGALLDVMLAVSVLSLGLFLAGYLIRTL